MAGRRVKELTPAEWQEAVDLAAAALVVHKAKQHGAISVDLDCAPLRCERILRRGAELGYAPRLEPTVQVSSVLGRFFGLIVLPPSQLSSYVKEA